VRVNLFSDTQTRPTPAMREAMPDEVATSRSRATDRELPVVLAASRTLGKEAAVFIVPSGNDVHTSAATLVHCRPGDEILAHESAHIIAREAARMPPPSAVFQITPLKGPDGQFSPDAFRAALHPRTRYHPPQTLSAPSRRPYRRRHDLE